MRFGAELAIPLKRDLRVSLYTVKNILKLKQNLPKETLIQIFIMIKCEKKRFSLYLFISGID